MAKTVFSTTAEVCAVWAAQEQEHARTGSNTSFRGATLYSYGTAIGRLVAPPPGERIALISSDHFSSGTSKVQGEARDACKARSIAAFTVPAIVDPFASVARNLAYYDDLISTHAWKIERATRWDTAATWRTEAMRTIGEAALFAKAFGAVWLPPVNPMAIVNPKEIRA